MLVVLYKRSAKNRRNGRQVSPIRSSLPVETIIFPVKGTRPNTQGSDLVETDLPETPQTSRSSMGRDFNHKVTDLSSPFIPVGYRSKLFEFLSNQDIGAFTFVSESGITQLLVTMLDGVKSFPLKCSLGNVRLVIDDALMAHGLIDTRSFSDLNSLVQYYLVKRRGIPFVLLQQVI